MDFDDKHHIPGCTAIRATPKAVLVESSIFEQDIWVPRSQIDDESEVWDVTPDAQGPGTLVVSAWFAENKGLA